MSTDTPISSDALDAIREASLFTPFNTEIKVRTSPYIRVEFVATMATKRVAQAVQIAFGRGRVVGRCLVVGRDGLCAALYAADATPATLALAEAYCGMRGSPGTALDLKDKIVQAKAAEALANAWRCVRSSAFTRLGRARTGR